MILKCIREVSFSSPRYRVRCLSSASKPHLTAEEKKKDFEYCVDIVQNRDRESYLCGLLMPSKARKSYFAIRAFNAELASIKDGSQSKRPEFNQTDGVGVTSAALKLRTQWWRNALKQIYGENVSETASPDDLVAALATSCWKNPVVRVLDEAVHDSDLTRRFLERLLEAREADLDVQQVDTMDDAVTYAENTFASLLYLSLETTDVSHLGYLCTLLSAFI